MTSEALHDTAWTSASEFFSPLDTNPETFETLDPEKPDSEIPESLRAFHGQGHGKSVPRYKKEKPIHRVILFLRAQGLSYREISEQTGMSPSGVSWICAQLWFKEQLVALLNSQGLDPVKELIKASALDSVYKVIELRDKANNENVQMRSAIDLLDRYLGKSVQPIAPEKAPLADEKKLDAEIAELTEKLARN